MPCFDPAVLEPNPELRARMLAVLQAALDAVDPYVAVRNVLESDDTTLQLAGRAYALADFANIYVVGAGKAGAPMAQAVADVLGERITGGQVVVKTGHSQTATNARPSSLVIREAAHPIPDAAGLAAGREILEIAQQAGPQDLIIALLSGGGSALLVAPATGITLDDLQQMTDALLASGASINEINCLRKHCSAVKGGQLARAAHTATLVTLALSDVIGSPLDVIASGPTVPDASTWQDAWTIVSRYGLQDKLPPAIAERLQAGLDGHLPDTPKADDPVFAESRTLVIADNRIAALAAQTRAKNIGYNALLLTTFLEGEAAQIGKAAVALGKEVLEYGAPIAAPACLILGGETTVTLGENPGAGGRNQELTLSAALGLQEWPSITVVSLATDGTDGPTNSAGGMVDSGTVARGKAANLDAETHLRAHNAFPYLQATHDLLVTGPTQTNVNDLVFVFIEPNPA
ncbi:MAG: glycerate kinase [Litorilinea sp.]